MLVWLLDKTNKIKLSKFKYKYLLFKEIFLIIIIFSLILMFMLVSCRPGDDESTKTVNSNNSNVTRENGLYLFDCEKIKLEGTDTTDIKIKNCNLYIDIYEELVLMGEVENISPGIKTDIGITLDFYGKNGDKIISRTIPAFADYIKTGDRLPFCYYIDEKEKYIDMSVIKIGVNYKDYNEIFEGNPVAKIEKYYYDDDGDSLVIEGRVINIGSEKIRNLKLFCTFYNSSGKVVFIRKCYLQREEMIPDEEQNFSLKILFDEYIPEFTNYRFEVFFEDAIKTPVNL
ncbi:MAG: hypothetical protein PHG41_00200 [Actinomycetota bacterium]|nr:hypothetical protein [Actinomycetota bacterium]